MYSVSYKIQGEKNYHPLINWSFEKVFDAINTAKALADAMSSPDRTHDVDLYITSTDDPFLHDFAASTDEYSHIA